MELMLGDAQMTILEKKEEVDELARNTAKM
jgi:hypothetical protein